MKLTVFAAALATIAIAAPQSSAQSCSSKSTASSWKAGHEDIVDTAVAAGSFKTLAAALNAAELIPTLKGEGPFTVFAPSDEAFAKLPEKVVADLLKPENRAQLVNVLTYHVVPGKVTADKVVRLSNAATVNGQRLAIHVEEGTVSVDGANVVKTDIQCSNGVIHVIDTVMLPNLQNVVEIAAGNGSFGTLVAAVKAAGLAETLSGEGPFTIFAPTDEAFAKLPAGTVENLLKPENRDQLVSILKLHVVPARVYSDQALELGEAQTLLGQKVHIQRTPNGARIGEAELLKADIQGTNGVIHVIDRVLLPE
jgi:uncharacterized surface protein with fasciclin (FAS1) repeats